MIEFREVTVRYRAAPRPALQAVTLVARAGEVTAVVGPNGSGKTTLVRALLGRTPAQSGEIVLGGVSRSSMDQRAFARAVAVVGQREEPAFPMEVRDYVSLARFPHTSRWAPFRVSDRHTVDAAIERAGVAPLAGRMTDELSGGEWQSVRIARALAQSAGALVLDEPTTFLDVGHEMAVFELLSALAASGMAVLVVSHQLNLVARFATHMALLSAGRVAAAGTPEQVMQAQVLENVYRWPLVVVREAATGSLTLTPLRKSGT